MTEQEKDGKINMDETPKNTPQKRKTKKRRKGVSKKSTKKISANESVTEANNASDTRFNSGISSANIQRENKKTGKKSWQPSSLLHIPEENKDPNFAYRALRNDPANLVKKQADGWEIDQTGVVNNSQTINDSRGLGSVSCIRELIIARMPKETKKARDEYYQGKVKSAKEQEINEKMKIGGEENATGTIERYKL
jgi:hypothetical protein